MTNKNLVRQGTESTNSLNRLTGYTGEYPSFPTLYREMSTWMHDWDNLLSEFIGPRWNLQGRTDSPVSNQGVSRFNPAIDIREGEQGYIITAELPGIAPEDVDISVQEGALLLTGEKKFEHESKGDGYHRMERSYGSFRRAIKLPKGVDVDQIDATFNNGLLSLSIPKLPEMKPQARKIEIKTANQAQAQLTEQHETPENRSKK